MSFENNLESYLEADGDKKQKHLDKVLEVLEQETVSDPDYYAVIQNWNDLPEAVKEKSMQVFSKSHMTLDLWNAHAHEDIGKEYEKELLEMADQADPGDKNFQFLVRKKFTDTGSMLPPSVDAKLVERFGQVIFLDAMYSLGKDSLRTKRRKRLDRVEINFNRILNGLEQNNLLPLKYDEINPEMREELGKAVANISVALSAAEFLSIDARKTLLDFAINLEVNPETREEVVEALLAGEDLSREDREELGAFFMESMENSGNELTKRENSASKEGRSEEYEKDLNAMVERASPKPSDKEFMSLVNKRFANKKSDLPPEVDKAFLKKFGQAAFVGAISNLEIHLSFEVMTGLVEMGGLDKESLNSINQVSITLDRLVKGLKENNLMPLNHGDMDPEMRTKLEQTTINISESLLHSNSLSLDSRKFLIDSAINFKKARKEVNKEGIPKIRSQIIKNFLEDEALSVEDRVDLTMSFMDSLIRVGKIPSKKEMRVVVNNAPAEGREATDYAKRISQLFDNTPQKDIDRILTDSSFFGAKSPIEIAMKLKNHTMAEAMVEKISPGKAKSFDKKLAKIVSSQGGG